MHLPQAAAGAPTPGRQTPAERAVLAGAGSRAARQTTPLSWAFKRHPAIKLSVHRLGVISSAQKPQITCP